MAEVKSGTEAAVAAEAGASPRISCSTARPRKAARDLTVVGQLGALGLVGAAAMTLTTHSPRISTSSRRRRRQQLTTAPPPGALVAASVDEGGPTWTYRSRASLRTMFMYLSCSCSLPSTMPRTPLPRCTTTRTRLWRRAQSTARREDEGEARQ